MSRRNGTRKLGTARGSPRRTRTAKAARISRRTVKSCCAREWGGWGRISDDGPGQNNPDRSEGPWGRAGWPARTEVLTGASSLTQRGGNTMAAESTKDDGKPVRWEGPV
jgi:hypothetical protein